MQSIFVAILVYPRAPNKSTELARPELTLGNGVHLVVPRQGWIVSKFALRQLLGHGYKDNACTPYAKCFPIFTGNND